MTEATRPESAGAELTRVAGTTLKLALDCPDPQSAYGYATAALELADRATEAGGGGASKAVALAAGAFIAGFIHGGRVRT